MRLFSSMIGAVRRLRMRYYFFKGTFWKMPPLDLEADDAARRLVKDAVASAQNSPGSLAKTLDSLYEHGLIHRLIEIVLKPVFGFKYWNKMILAIRGRSGPSPARIMYNHQIARVVTNFFFVNGRWIGAYLSSVPGSIFNSETIPIWTGGPQLKNPFSHLRTDPSKKPSSSSTVQPNASMSGSQ